jgi:hypothetical protein
MTSVATTFSVGTLLHRLRRDGVTVTVREGNLHVRPAEMLTPELLDTLREHKAEIVRAVRMQSLTSGEWEVWHERVAICMVDGKVSQAEAEVIAWQQMEQVRQTKPPTTLQHCRCVDCQRFSRDGQQYHCRAGIGGTKVRWSDGHRECDPAPAAWHYCAEYKGPVRSPHTFVWRYDDAPVAQQDVDVGPRAIVSAEAANDTTAASATPRRPTSREGQCQRGEDRVGG